MTTPSGAISINDIAVELAIGNAGLNLNDGRVRTLGAFAASGIVDMNGLRGKSNIFYFNFAGSDINLRDAAISAGWNQVSKVQATIQAGFVVFATATSKYALLIPNSFPAGVTLVNNGVIVGCGGSGGNGGLSTSNAGAGGGGGGPALGLSQAVTIHNNGSINGGGGGGGGGGATFFDDGAGTTAWYGGGGGGGGASGNQGSAGGAGFEGATGGGGGGYNSAGAGGEDGAGWTGTVGQGGAGGSWGNAGAAGNTGPAGNGASYAGGPAGPAGFSVVASANATWANTGTLRGPTN